MKIINGNTVGYFSVITEAELLSGARNDKEEASIYDVLDIMEAIEIERKMAVTAGNLMRKYAAYGTQLPDALIAATAKERKLIVATANKKHFKVFTEIEWGKENDNNELKTNSGCVSSFQFVGFRC